MPLIPHPGSRVNISVEEIRPGRSDFFMNSRYEDTCAAVAPPSPSSPTHVFTQDPNEQATLCGEPDCGMWPEHHNHTGRSRWSGGQCICQECETNPDFLG